MENIENVKKSRGRNKIPDSNKKIAIRVWMESSHVEILGGKEKVQMDLENDIKFKVLAKTN